MTAGTQSRVVQPPVADAGRTLDRETAAILDAATAETIDGAYAITQKSPTADVPVAAGAEEASALDQGVRVAGAEEASALDQNAQIAGAVVDLVRLYGSIRARVTSPEGDLSPLFLLVRLAHQGPSRTGELAGQVCADPSTVSRQVATLVRAGLVERRVDPDDRRASILLPTAEGRRVVAAHARRRGATVRPVIQNWPQKDSDEFLRLLRTYIAGVEEHREEMIAILSDSDAVRAASGRAAASATSRTVASATSNTAVPAETNSTAASASRTAASGTSSTAASATGSTAVPAPSSNNAAPARTTT